MLIITFYYNESHGRIKISALQFKEEENSPLMIVHLFFFINSAFIDLPKPCLYREIQRNKTISSSSRSVLSNTVHTSHMWPFKLKLN